MTEFGMVGDLPVLKVSREIGAPIERVFEAWIDAAVISKWFGPPGFVVRSAESEAVVGGRYNIVLVAPDGSEIFHFGEYLRIERFTQLSFTWMLADQDCEGGRGKHEETQVTISFSDLDGRTRIDLLHAKLPDQVSRDGHQMGWEGCLTSIDELFSE